MAKKKAVCKTAISYNGKTYPPGSEIELDDKEYKRLMDMGKRSPLEPPKKKASSKGSGNGNNSNPPTPPTPGNGNNSNPPTPPTPGKEGPPAPPQN